MLPSGPEVTHSALTVEHDRLMSFVALQWNAAVAQRSPRGVEDLSTALMVGHRRAGAALSDVFRRPGLAAQTRRQLLSAHGDLDATMTALSTHRVGTPGWWLQADALVRGMADAFRLAVALAPRRAMMDAFSFEDQPTSVFRRPDFDDLATLPCY
jgi:hypothetical protein